MPERTVAGFFSLLAGEHTTLYVEAYDWIAHCRCRHWGEEPYALEGTFCVMEATFEEALARAKKTAKVIAERLAKQRGQPIVVKILDKCGDIYGSPGHMIAGELAGFFRNER